MVERAFASLYGRLRHMFSHAGFESEMRPLWSNKHLITTNEKKSPYEKFY